MLDADLCCQFRLVASLGRPHGLPLLMSGVGTLTGHTRMVMLLYGSKLFSREVTNMVFPSGPLVLDMCSSLASLLYLRFVGGCFSRFSCREFILGLVLRTIWHDSLGFLGYRQFAVLIR